MVHLTLFNHIACDYSFNLAIIVAFSHDINCTALQQPLKYKTKKEKNYLKTLHSIIYIEETKDKAEREAYKTER